MRTKEPVSSIMSASVLSVDLYDPLSDVERMMRKYHIRHVPVISGGHLAGMLSLTDLQRLSFADHFGEFESQVDNVMYDMLTTEQVMVNNPVSVDVGTSIEEVADILTTHEFHALPVTEDGELVGIVTTTDLIRHLMKHQ